MNNASKTFCIGVDGSEVAHLAFQTALRLRKKEDNMDVFHISDRNKTYLPYDLEPDHIQDAYETLLVANVPADHRVVRVEEKKEGQSTKGAACEYVNGSDPKPDFLFVGCAGRKGPKEDPTILGTTADYSLRATHCSSVICKRLADGFATRPLPAAGGGSRPNATFLVCVDESPNSEKAYDEAVRLAHDDGDKVVVLHVFDDERDDGTETTAEEVQAKYQGKGATDVQLVAKVGGKPLGVHICEYAWDQDMDFVVIGADGMTAYRNGRGQLGSVSDYVVKNAKCNVVVTEILTGN